MTLVMAVLMVAVMGDEKETVGTPAAEMVKAAAKSETMLAVVLLAFCSALEMTAKAKP